MHAMARKTKKRIRTPHILVPPTPERMAKVLGRWATALKADPATVAYLEDI